MKKIEAIVITDTHLKDSNIQLVESIFEQTLLECKKQNVSRLFHAGDFFTSRTGQSVEVLAAAKRIFDLFVEARIDFIIIAGNHDKTDQNSLDSYLSVFNDYIKLVKDYAHLSSDNENICFHFLPYFKENSGFYEEKIKAIEKTFSGKNILITHCAINGVKNNDGSEVQHALPQGLFGFFDKVLVGHYHDKSKVGKNIYYIGSAYQANFGENEEKGLTYIYNDGNLGFKKLDFPKYETVTVNVDTVDKQFYEDVIEAKKSGFVRVEILGDKEQIESNETIKNLKDLGVSIKKSESFSIVSNLKEEVYDDNVLLILERFCTEKGISFKEAKEIFENSKS